MRRILWWLFAGTAAFSFGFCVCAMSVYLWILSHFRQADFDTDFIDITAEAHRYPRYPRPLDNDWKAS